jgi:hypothetical protein
MAIDGRRIPTGKFLSALMALALLVAAFVHYGIEGHPWSAPSVAKGAAETIGAAIVLVLPSLLILVPWRLIQGRKAEVTNIPIFVAGALFLLMSILLTSGWSIKAL